MRGAALLIVVVVALLGLWAQAAQAQEAPPPCGGKVASSSAAGGPCGDVTGSSADIGVEQGQANAVTDAVGKNKIAINFAWTLVTGFLVMFMQAGFALVETGFCRRKNAAHVMMTNFMIYASGSCGCSAARWPCSSGGVGHIANLGGTNPLTSELHAGGWGLFGTKGFGFNGIYDVGVMAHFLFNLVFMDTAATIVTGAMAERWKFSAFVVYGFWISMVIYPLFGNWAWGGGWLAQLGSKSGLGHGYVDFAGSGVVHAIGGFTGLAGAMVIGPRLGKYNRDGTSNTILPHSLPMAILGCFILAFGWFGFNPGSTLAATDLRISVVAVNTMLASASGALMAAFYMKLKTDKWDPGMMANGMLAGLVAITAPCAFVTATSAVIIGAIAGLLVIWAYFFIDRKLKIDDPVGAIAVHGVNGFWGVLSLGLFADGSYGQGWNGVGADKYMGVAGKGVTGLFYGDASQFFAELIGGLTCFVFVFVVMYIFFKICKATIGLRSSEADEVGGLDIPEMGVHGYVD